MIERAAARVETRHRLLESRFFSSYQQLPGPRKRRPAFFAPRRLSVMGQRGTCAVARNVDRRPRPVVVSSNRQTKPMPLAAEREQPPPWISRCSCSFAGRDHQRRSLCAGRACVGAGVRRHRVSLIPQGEFVAFAALRVATLENGRLPGTVAAAGAGRACRDVGARSVPP
jgi:hypothetical protein